MAITINELNATQGSDETRALARIGRSIIRTMHTMQFTRMAHEISMLSESQLRMIGMTRDEVLQNTRESIYGAYD